MVYDFCLSAAPEVEAEAPYWIGWLDTVDTYAIPPKVAKGSPILSSPLSISSHHVLSCRLMSALNRHRVSAESMCARALTVTHRVAYDPVQSSPMVRWASRR